MKTPKSGTLFFARLPQVSICGRTSSHPGGVGSKCVKFLYAKETLAQRTNLRTCIVPTHPGINASQSRKLNSATKHKIELDVRIMESCMHEKRYAFLRSYDAPYDSSDIGSKLVVDSRG